MYVYMKSKQTGNVLRYLYSRFSRTVVRVQLRKPDKTWGVFKDFPASKLLDEYTAIDSESEYNKIKEESK